MASPSGSQNGGILGVSNKTSFGKCTVTAKTSSTPSAVTTQPGTRFIDTIIVAGAGGGGDDGGGGGGAGGTRRINCISVTGGAALGAVVIGAGGAGGNSPGPGVKGIDSSIAVDGTTYTSTGGGAGGGDGVNPAGPSDAGAGQPGGSGGGRRIANPFPAGTGNAGGFDPVEGFAGAAVTPTGGPNYLGSGGG